MDHETYLLGVVERQEAQALRLRSELLHMQGDQRRAGLLELIQSEHGAKVLRRALTRAGISRGDIQTRCSNCGMQRRGGDHD